MSESPIIEQAEKEREKLLSLLKYLEINTRTRVPIKISVEFENKKFGDKGFAVIDVSTSSRILKSLVKALEEAAEEELDQKLKELRTLNSETDSE